MHNHFEQDLQSTRDAFIANSLTPAFVITPRPDGNVVIDRQVMDHWDFAERSRRIWATISPPSPMADSLPPPQQQVLTTLQGAFANLSASRQSQLAAIEPLSETDPDTFKARMEALRKSTIDAVHTAVNKAYDDLQKAGLQAPATQPLCLEAAQLVGQLAQGFVNTASSAFDAADHAGALVIDGLSAGASAVAHAFSAAADAIENAGKVIVHGLKSIFSGW